MGYERTAFVFAAWLSATTLAPQLARAQTAEDRATARLLVDEADAKLRQNDLEGAFERFTRASQLVKAPTLILEMARIRAKQGRLVDARGLYMDVARIPKEPSEPSQWADARAAAAAEGAAVGERMPKLVLKVQGGDPNRTTVTIDGVEVPKAALDIPRAVDPGTKTVRVTCDGFEPFEQRIDAPERSTRDVAVQLVPDILLDYGLTAAAHANARAPLRNAKKLLDAGDQAGAAEQLRAADAAVQAPTIKRALADQYAKLHKLVEEEASLQQLGRMPASPNEPPSWRAARADVESRLAALQTRIPVVTFAFPNELQGKAIAVSIDGVRATALAGTSSYRVNPGRHVVHVDIPGMAALEAPFEIAESARTTATINLTQRAAAAAAPATTKSPAHTTSEQDEEPSESDGLGPLSDGFVFVPRVGLSVWGAGAVSTACSVTGSFQCPLGEAYTVAFDDVSRLTLAFDAMYAPEDWYRLGLGLTYVPSTQLDRDGEVFQVGSDLSVTGIVEGAVAVSDDSAIAVRAMGGAWVVMSGSDLETAQDNARAQCTDFRQVGAECTAQTGNYLGWTAGAGGAFLYSLGDMRLRADLHLQYFRAEIVSLSAEMPQSTYETADTLKSTRVLMFVGAEL